MKILVRKRREKEREEERELVGYPTGDMVVLRKGGGEGKEGWLEYRGRKKEGGKGGKGGGEVKVRGFRVNLGGLGGKIVECCEGIVKEAYVMVGGQREREGGGKGEGELVAFCVFVGGKGGREGEEEVRKRMGRAVPEYMVPSVVVEVGGREGEGEGEGEGLPLTKNLKVDERVLLGLLGKRREGRGGKEKKEKKRKRIVRRRREGVEKGVEECWKKILGGRWKGREGEKEREKLSFFEMGGDSLLLLGLSSSLSHRFGVYISPSLLLSLPTLGDQVEWMEEKVGGGKRGRWRRRWWKRRRK